jgi:hypothetical protein
MVRLKGLPARYFAKGCPVRGLEVPPFVRSGTAAQLTGQISDQLVGGGKRGRGGRTPIVQLPWAQGGRLCAAPLAYHHRFGEGE